jgi:hypothetical protein
MTSQALERAYVPTGSGQLLPRHAEAVDWDLGDNTNQLWRGTPSLPRSAGLPYTLSCTAYSLDDRCALFMTNPTILSFVLIQEPIRIEFTATTTANDVSATAPLPFSQAWLRASYAALRGAPGMVAPLEHTLPASRAVRTPTETALQSEPTSDAYEPKTSSLGSGPHQALEEIARWTRLPPEELGSLWGVSRRSVYNWLNGKPIGSPEVADQIVRTYEELSPLDGSRDPLYFRLWLEQGQPSPAEIIRARSWRELRSRVSSELIPLLPLEPAPPSVRDEAAGYGDEALRAVSHALRTILPAAPAVRPSWSPREITGLGEDDGEESDL